MLGARRKKNLFDCDLRVGSIKRYTRGDMVFSEGAINRWSIRGK